MLMDPQLTLELRALNAIPVDYSSQYDMIPSIAD